MPHVGDLRAPRPDEDPEAAALEADVDRLLAGHPPGIQAIERALRTILAARGFAISHDVSERAFQHERGGTIDKGKSCETFNPLGPWLVTPDEVRARSAHWRPQVPDAVERVDFGNKLIAFGRSMKMRGLLFAIIAHAAHVNLQLADGAELPDPDGLIEGTGKRIRHVKVRSVEAASAAPVVAIIRAQLAARPEG